MQLIYALFTIISFSLLSSELLSSDCKKPEMPNDKKWQKWIDEIKIEGIKNGISETTLNNELNSVKPQSKIILRDRCQPESRITLKEYLFYRLNKGKIYAGKKMMNKHKKLLEEISNHFKIQPRFIIAILGMESYYGENQGKIKTMDAVTTLAFDRRRSDFYKKQLFATLKIIDDDLVPSKNLKGSWGGALGMTQMLPTTFLESGYDWDGNGVDIWNSYADSFASIANYLTSLDKNPWSDNYTWGREVIPPNDIDKIYDSLKQKNPKGCGAVKSRSIPKKLQEWQKLGFRDFRGNDLPIDNNLDARLIAPDGINGKFFLVYQNYKNILYYNCSSYYAISIGLLSDEIIN